jgi:multiple sugar transport system ATP-binding protein
VTTAYVTHDQVEAMTMGDRVAVFNHGQLLQIGSPDDLYNAPENLFVAQFIGSPKMNLVDGELAGVEGDAVSVRFVDQVVTIPGRRSIPGLKAGKKLQVGVRPHDLVWEAEAPARCSVKVPVTVDIAEHTGSEIFVLAAFAQDVTLMARLHRSAEIAPGERISFCLDPTDLHVFDADSGETVLRRTGASANGGGRANASSNEGSPAVATAAARAAVTQGGDR